MDRYRTPAALAAPVAGAVVAALGLGFVLGATAAPDAGGGRALAAGDDGGSAADPRYVDLADGVLSRAETCEDLLAWYVARGRQLVGPWGWGYPVYAEDSGSGTPVPAEGPAAEDGGAPGTPRTDEQSGSETGTNVQEVGVDEPDVVKTDGSVLVRVQGDRLQVYDVTGAEPELRQSVPLPDLVGAELLLAGDRVFAVGRDRVAEEEDGQPGSRMLVVDVSDPSAAGVVQTYTYDGQLVTARQHGDVVRLVLSAGLPDLDFVEPGVWRDEEGARRRNQDIVSASTIDDWLPQVTTWDGDTPSTEPLVDCADVALPEDDDAGLGTLTITGFTADDPATWDTRGIATTSQTAYLSTDMLYLADASPSFGPCCWTEATEAWGAGGDTRLYAFELAGTATTYVASGEVEGLVADRWSMDEADGVLRVAVGPTQQTGDFNSVVTLRRNGAYLEQVGRVDKLGVGEQIQSVRWFDDLAVVVTFRQVDPLYAVDLTDPEAPRLLGTLKVPWFSDYLHPVGEDLLVGLGAHGTAAGTTGSAQAALFDVSDLRDPERLSAVRYRASTVALAGDDPRQFTWLPGRDIALTVVARQGTGQTGYVSVLRVRDGRLVNRMVEVEYGADVYGVRLVPLARGKVALVTGEDVTAFDVSG